MEKYFIGVDFEEGVAVDSKTTQGQIDKVKKLNCKLVDEKGEVLTWDVFDDPNESRTLFQAILKDRQMRIDNKTFMADRPNFAVITTEGNDAIRLEYYEGHDYLSKVYDIRSKELVGQQLSDTYKEW